jgi:hypothetical protein
MAMGMGMERHEVIVPCGVAREETPLNQYEEWRAAPEHPAYMVSSLGRVWRLKGHGAPHGEVMPYVDHKQGYLRVCLYNHGKRTRWWVHRLIAVVFLGPEPDGKPYVRHLDGNPANNAASNLAWGTAAENELDKHRYFLHNQNLADTEQITREF